ncbi:MAG: hypothetical protein QOE61_1619, partial [Micromonosporaceae bacterium]|nr:hypothetical protein [Micromonosporaceae bacterium]
PLLDVVTILAPNAALVDFTGYYLCGPDNPYFERQSAESGSSIVVVVTWDKTQAKFLPSTRDDWRPWPWPRGVDPYMLVMHGNDAQLALVIGDTQKPVAPWALGSWARRTPGLNIEVRPLVDPLVLMGCMAAWSRQWVADEVGRLVWAPTGDISLGAEPINLADKSVGVKASVALHRTADGRAGRFLSAYPQGPAGDRVRWAYREQFSTDDLSWMADQIAPAGAVAPTALWLREIRGSTRLFGWSFYDERDWNSRQAALNPVSIASTSVTWIPNHAYRPGTPRQLDPQTWALLPSAEPWNIDSQAPLPFDVDDAMFVLGYFVHGRFLVSNPAEGLSYLESAEEFGVRLKREHAIAATAALARGQALPRALVLLTDNEPVPQSAARVVARTLDDVDVITASLPGTLFLDDHPGAGIPQTRVALMPGSRDTRTQVWTRTRSGGLTDVMAPIPSTSGRPRSSQEEQPIQVTGSFPALPSKLDRTRWQALLEVRQSLQAGIGLTQGAARPGLRVPGTPVLAVSRHLGVAFAGVFGQEGSATAMRSLQVDGVVDLLEINGDYDANEPVRLDPVTAKYVPAGWPMLVVGRGRLPFDAADDPFYVLVDHYGGYFLLRAGSDPGEAVTVYKENPQDFGARIREAIGRAGPGRGEATAARRPVVLLARHRPVSPQTAAAVAAALVAVASDVYTASMPATAYIPRADAEGVVATLALICLPGQSGQTSWTRTTPEGLATRIDPPILPPEIETSTAGVEGTLSSREEVGSQFEPTLPDAVERASTRPVEPLPTGADPGSPRPSAQPTSPADVSMPATPTPPVVIAPTNDGNPIGIMTVTADVGQFAPLRNSSRVMMENFQPHQHTPDTTTPSAVDSAPSTTLPFPTTPATSTGQTHDGWSGQASGTSPIRIGSPGVVTDRTPTTATPLDSPTGAASLTSNDTWSDPASVWDPLSIADATVAPATRSPDPASPTSSPTTRVSNPPPAPKSSTLTPTLGSAPETARQQFPVLPDRTTQAAAEPSPPDQATWTANTSTVDSQHMLSAAASTTRNRWWTDPIDGDLPPVVDALTAATTQPPNQTNPTTPNTPTNANASTSAPASTSTTTPDKTGQHTRPDRTSHPTTPTPPDLASSDTTPTNSNSWWTDSPTTIKTATGLDQALEEGTSSPSGAALFAESRQVAADLDEDRARLGNLPPTGTGHALSHQIAENAAGGLESVMSWWRGRGGAADDGGAPVAVVPDGVPTDVVNWLVSAGLIAISAPATDSPMWTARRREVGSPQVVVDTGDGYSEVVRRARAKRRVGISDLVPAVRTWIRRSGSPMTVDRDMVIDEWAGFVATPDLFARRNAVDTAAAVGALLTTASSHVRTRAGMVPLTWRGRLRMNDPELVREYGRKASALDLARPTRA